MVLPMEKIEDVIFYVLEKSIKSYRQYAQQQIKKAGYSITIDQWLLLKNVQENPTLNQQDLAKKVFKDNASITRITELLVRSGLLDRKIYSEDKRSNSLSVTKEGLRILNEVQDIVLLNRAKALEGVDLEELELMKRNLHKIIQNVKNEN